MLRVEPRDGDAARKDDFSCLVRHADAVLVLARGILVAALPDARWAPAVSNLGYTVGFLIVILGRIQLFAGNTVMANMLGCLLAAAVLAHVQILPTAQFEGLLDVARHYAKATAMQQLTWGIPAGFLIASLVWIIPRMTGAGEVLVIVMLTYVIGLGGMSHGVAGSTELFVLLLHSELSLGQVTLRGIAPALAGNVIGGTGMFAALTYTQVRKEVPHT